MPHNPLDDFTASGPVRSGPKAPPLASQQAQGRGHASAPNLPAEPIADALVLVCSNIQCSCCGKVTFQSEHRTFLRKGMRYTINRVDKIFTRTLPREIKLLQFTAEYCAACFVSRTAIRFVENACSLTDPILSSLNAGDGLPTEEELHSAP